jgi:hypothetical protein
VRDGLRIKKQEPSAQLQRRISMKTIIKTAIAAFALIAGANASQAQAGDVEWYYPYKGTPYAKPSVPAQQVAPAQTVRHGNHVHTQTTNKTQVNR